MSASAAARRPKQATTASEIIEKQKQTLVSAIKDADREEAKRLQRLDNLPTKEARAALEARFDHDRTHDQERIKHLLFDYKVLKEKCDDGELPTLLESRARLTGGVRQTNNGQPLVNRFAGCEDENDATFMRQVYKRFDTLEAQAKRRTLPKYNESFEHHKLKLLNQKRELLHKLVAVQTNELNGCVTGGGSSRPSVPFPSYGGRQSARDSDKMSTTSGESWATFATRSSRGGVTRPNMPKPPPVPVPKLKI